MLKNNTPLGVFLVYNYVEVHIMGRKPLDVIHCDFETTTKEVSEQESRVWLWGAILSSGEFVYDLTIESYFKFLDDFKENKIIYFHNGSRFDFEFIKHFLGENRRFAKDNKSILPGEAWVMAKNQSTTYSIWYRNMRGHMIYFKCSFMFLKAALAKLPGSQKQSKDQEFYSKYREYKHKSEVSYEDLEYLKYDIITQKKAMDEYARINNITLRAYTSTGIAWKKFKKSIKDFNKKYKNQITYEEHRILAKWGTGAINYLNDKYKQRIVENVGTWDINSLYTYAMLNTLIPYGKPIYQCKAECEHNFQLLELRVSGSLKRGYIPCLTTSRSLNQFATINWMSEFTNDVLYLTKQMWEQCSEYYNWSNVELINKICFKSTLGIGHEFLEQCMARKEQAPNGSIERDAAKLDMNGCYGRFMMSPIQSEWTMELIDENATIPHFKTRYGKYYMKEQKVIQEEIMYSPAGIAILSNARQWTIKWIQENRDKFIYTDTDSITIIASKESDFKGPIHNTKVGAFKFEGFQKLAYFIKLKMYTKADENGIIKEAKGAGIDAKISFLGKSIYDVANKTVKTINKQMIKVKGGRYMDEKIKIIKGYNDEEVKKWLSEMKE